ncbi:MAG: response regulator [Terracidiphilus sp.]
MTTEPTVPQQDLGSSPTNGQGQSQGHRRRRRRRKNKSNQPGGQPQVQQQNPPQQAQPQMQAPQQPQQQGGPPKQASGRHRKKKKFFQQKTNTPQPGPGNSIAPQHNGRRKERQKGPRTFVGPMDHSYRTVNGNVADGPPSTIPTSSNGHHGGYYGDVNVGAPTLPVKADAPTRIFCFIDDLFFQAKIQETAKKLGVKVEFVKGEKETVTRILDTPEGEKPTLVVFDLNNLNAKPMTLIPKFKTRFKKATSIIGFLNHLQGDLKMKALESGCDTVMPRSAFSQSLPNLLRRYGLEEEDEYVPQPV